MTSLAITCLLCYDEPSWRSLVSGIRIHCCFVCYVFIWTSVIASFLVFLIMFCSFSESFGQNYPEVSTQFGLTSKIYLDRVILIGFTFKVNLALLGVLTTIVYVEQQEADGTLDCISMALTCTFNRWGTLLAVGCNDGRIVIWDFLTRGIAKIISAHIHPVCSLRSVCLQLCAFVLYVWHCVENVYAFSGSRSITGQFIM